MELEQQTRALRIDPKLTAAGWHIVRLQPNENWRGKSRCAIEEFETAHGPADYALCDKGSVLGVVEAKKLTLGPGPEGVLTQAARYSRGLSTTEFELPDGHKVPFLYSTNGERIMFHDLRSELSRSREVSCFHTIDSLREMLGSDLDSEVARLSTIPMHGSIRPYQVEANEAIEDAIAHRKRKMLVTMATGTGKTLALRQRSSCRYPRQGGVDTKRRRRRACCWTNRRGGVRAFVGIDSDDHGRSSFLR